MLFVTRSGLFAAARSGRGPVAGGRCCRGFTGAALIYGAWRAVGMLVAAPAALLLLAVTVDSRVGPGLGRGGRGARRCSPMPCGCIHRAHPVDPRGALSALSLG